MKMKQYVYKSNDIEYLKKDNKISFIYSLIAVFCLILQIVCLIKHQQNHQMNVLKIIVAITVISYSIALGIVLIYNLIRNQKIIKNVAKNGHYNTKILLTSDGNKNSFLKLYSLISQVFSILMIIILACGITYSILELIYFANFSYYIPLIILLSSSGFYSGYCTKKELKLIKEVQDYNSIY